MGRLASANTDTINTSSYHPTQQRSRLAGRASPVAIGIPMWQRRTSPARDTPSRISAVHAVDYTIIAAYLAAMVGIGLYFGRRQVSPDEFFVGNRKMGAGHVGFSIVATDVGGGFSIGLGGLGFAMGISASWLLFTGLLGAWLAIVILIPRVKAKGDAHSWLTFADYLKHRFDGRTRLLAAVVSGIGYAGFVGAQVLAGAKLTAVAFDLSLQTSVAVMATVVILYTALGGLEAVIYTDTVQWAVLLGGLLFVALPVSFVEVGGLEGIREALPKSHLSLWNIEPMKALTWLVTIVPIWFVANTLWQRIYATRDLKSARRAFTIAGLLEWPLMAFLGAALGMFARVKFPSVEPEMGLPLLIKELLPVGVVGIVLAAYFSAIMSTADSCLLASVGHFVNDIYQKYLRREAKDREVLRVGRALTVVIGALSVGVALSLPRVLDAILLAYSFMVSGLFIPTLAGLLWRRTTPRAAFYGMLTGGSTAVALHLLPKSALGGPLGPLLAEPILVALPLSALVLIFLTLVDPGDEGTVAVTTPES